MGAGLRAEAGGATNPRGLRNPANNKTAITGGGGLPRDCGGTPNAPGPHTPHRRASPLPHLLFGVFEGAFHSSTRFAAGKVNPDTDRRN